MSKDVFLTLVDVFLIKRIIDLTVHMIFGIVYLEFTYGVTDL